MIAADEQQWSEEDGLLPQEAPVDGYVQVSDVDAAGDPLGIVRGAGRVSLASSKKTDRTTRLHSYRLLESHQFIEFDESFVSSGLLVVDIDEPDSELRLAWAVHDGLVPPPSYYIVNDRNGHVQATWHYANFVRDPWHGGRDVDQETALRIRRQLPKQEFLLARLKASLTTVLHGDRCFTHTRFRNPYCTGKQRVMLPSLSVIRRPSDGDASTGLPADGKTHVRELYVYSLKAMAGFMDAAGSFNNGESERHGRNLVNSVIGRAGLDMHDGGMSPQVDGDVVVHEGMRNNTVFVAAVRAARNGMDARQAAESVNCSPRLSEKEIDHIVKSAEKCASKPSSSMAKNNAAAGGSHASGSAAKRLTQLPDDVRKTLSDLGRKGGTANTCKQRESRKRNLDRGRVQSRRVRLLNRDKVIRDLRKGGATALKFLKVGGVMHIASLKRIAERCGMSLSTVRRCISDIIGMLKKGWGYMISCSYMSQDYYDSARHDVNEVFRRFGRKAALAAWLEITSRTSLGDLLHEKDESWALSSVYGDDERSMVYCLMSPDTLSAVRF